MGATGELLRIPAAFLRPAQLRVNLDGAAYAMLVHDRIGQGIVDSSVEPTELFLVPPGTYDVIVEFATSCTEAACGPNQGYCTGFPDFF